MELIDGDRCVAETDAVLAAARAGDETAFSALVDRHRTELRVHCYRMLGSLDEAEDLVQETFLRAWRRLAQFEGRSTLRAWLYRIATNACLDVLGSGLRRVLPHHLAPASDLHDLRPVRSDVPWLQPFPDQLLEPVAPGDEDPAAVAVRRETIELAFIAAIQHLAPRPRAVLIMRDVLGWPAKQTAATLEMSLASVNSALHRARSTLRQELPDRRLDWSPTTAPDHAQRVAVRRYMQALERADLAAVAELLAEDIRTTMPPWPTWFQGRQDVMRALAASWDPTAPGYVGRFRTLPTRANGQPAVATYARRLDDTEHLPFAISVLTFVGTTITEIVAFHDVGLFPAFGLPATVPSAV